MRECPSCGATAPDSATECPSCRHEFGESEDDGLSTGQTLMGVPAEDADEKTDLDDEDSTRETRDAKKTLSGAKGPAPTSLVDSEGDGSSREDTSEEQDGSREERSTQRGAPAVPDTLTGESSTGSDEEREKRDTHRGAPAAPGALVGESSTGSDESSDPEAEDSRSTQFGLPSVDRDEAEKELDEESASAVSEAEREGEEWSGRDRSPDDARPSADSVLTAWDLSETSSHPEAEEDDDGSGRPGAEHQTMIGMPGVDDESDPEGADIDIPEPSGDDASKGGIIHGSTSTATDEETGDSTTASGGGAERTPHETIEGETPGNLESSDDGDDEPRGATVGEAGDPSMPTRETIPPENSLHLDGDADSPEDPLEPKERDDSPPSDADRLDASGAPGIRADGTPEEEPDTGKTLHPADEQASIEIGDAGPTDFALDDDERVEGEEDPGGAKDSGGAERGADAGGLPSPDDLAADLESGDETKDSETSSTSGRDEKKDSIEAVPQPRHDPARKGPETGPVEPLDPQEENAQNEDDELEEVELGLEEDSSFDFDEAEKEMVDVEVEERVESSGTAPAGESTETATRSDPAPPNETKPEPLSPSSSPDTESEEVAGAEPDRARTPRASEESTSARSEPPSESSPSREGTEPSRRNERETAPPADGRSQREPDRDGAGRPDVAPSASDARREDREGRDSEERAAAPVVDEEKDERLDDDNVVNFLQTAFGVVAGLTYAAFVAIELASGSLLQETLTLATTAGATLAAVTALVIPVAPGPRHVKDALYVGFGSLVAVLAIVGIGVAGSLTAAPVVALFGAIFGMVAGLVSQLTSLLSS